MLDKNVPQPWQGQTTLVFALAAAAVGLGNLYRLPWLLGEHGGAPFFLTYLATLLLVVVPVVIAEVMLGSHGRGSPLGAIRWASDQAGRSVYWSWLGIAQAVTAVLLAAQLLPLTVWMIDRALVLNAGTLASASAIDVADNFLAMTRAFESQFVKAGLLVAVVAFLVALGPKYAVGIMGWLALPVLAVTLLGLLEYTLNHGSLKPAGEYLFAQRYREFNVEAAMAGVGSALFTLGAGLGVGLCFGARTPKRLTLLRSVVAAAVLDTVFALGLSVVILPLLFATNTAPTEGLSLVFVAIPYAFGNLTDGEIYGALFFGFAALSGGAAILALMEPAVMILRRDVGLSRFVAAPCVAVCVLALTAVVHWAPGAFTTLLGLLTDNLIVLALLLIAIFVGWMMPRPVVRGELYREPRWLFATWWVLLRLLVPGVLLIWLSWRWSSLLPMQ